MQDAKKVSSSGWVDFNEASIGLTSQLNDGELYTEIRYISITDWYIKGKLIIAFGYIQIIENCTLVISVRYGKIEVEIDLGNNIKDILAQIFQKMNSRILKKQSETNRIILLANFKKTKCISTIRKSCDIAHEFSKMVWKSTHSCHRFRKDFKKANRKLTSIIMKRITKRFVHHVGYLKKAVEELRPCDVARPLKDASKKLTECIKLILTNK